uniref:mitogen-activated protein kinase kinase n=1 Tax=Octactis speculum TaxID=3111310 RepID=A0A7S2C4M9_9STRA
MNSTYYGEAIAVSKQGLRAAGGSADKSVNQKIASQVQPGELIIEEVLGRGACSEVKRATHRRTGEVYVVKCFNMFDKDKRAMLMKEVKFLLDIDCQTIVKWFGTYMDHDDQVNVVLEFMDRGSVEDLVKHCRRNRVPIPEQVLAAMAFQIIWGLGYLNCESLMHRDIKGGNILLNSQGEVKITDFGISRKLDDTDAKSDGDQRMASTVVGTKTYMSPERLEGKRYDDSADIWSLGIILVEAVTGNHPLIRCRNEVELLTTCTECASGTLAEIIDQGNMSDELVQLISWCLTVDPRHRARAGDILKGEVSWFDYHIGNTADKEAKLSMAVDIVADWLTRYVSDYRGPTASAAPKGGAAEGKSNKEIDDKMNLESWGGESDSD